MNRILTLCLVFLTAIAGAQTVDIDKLKGMKPRAIGPSGMSGRVTSIDVVHAQPDIIYAGTASGGLWKSTSGGITWEPIFDNEDVASIGAVAIHQDNPDIIWVGTGEGNPRNSITGGYGVYKSLDAGRTWESVGLKETRNVHRIIINKNNPDEVLIGAIGSPWGEHPERGVFKTRDGGKTWEKVLFVDNKTGCADLIVDPSNPNKLLAAMWEHRRKPYTFNSGGPGSGLYMSLDGGDTWTRQTAEKNGLPKGNLGRIGLAIATNKPNRVYALIESKKNALYRSEDGGYKWTKINDRGEIGNRPFYYYDIYVDPKNENRIYSLFSLVNISEDGGKSFRTLLPYSGVHPDHHAWWIHPDDPDYMIDGNDGGLNITRDGGKSWRFIENIPVGQFYHVAVDMEYPYNVYGGMQDNGSWVGPAYVLKSGGIRNSYWQEIMFGDGFDVVPDPDDSRFGYAMSQQGNVGRYDRVTGNTTTVRPTHPDPDVRLRFNWNSAIAQDPFDNSTIYYGSQFVHKSTDKGLNWDVISGDLTTNDPEKQKQHLSGGLTIDATGAENYTTILAIEPSAVQKDVIWVGTDDGKVHVTKDGGANWTQTVIPGMPSDGWVAQVKASKFDAGEAYVVVNNYRNFDFKPYLYRTRDFGATWQSLVNEDKVWGYTLAVVQDSVERNLLFLGTEYGLYFSIDEGANWTKWTNGYPTVSTIDLVIHPREHDLVIGTFGRAFYVLDDIRPLRELAAEGAGLLNKKLHLFTPPDGYVNYNQQAAGSRFAADAVFAGDNRRRGAMMSYYINREDAPKPPPPPPTKKKRGKKAEPVAETPKPDKKSKVKYDSIKIEIFKMNGDQIRTLKFKAPKEDGLHRTYWAMNEKGVERPRRGAGGGGGFGFGGGGGGRGEPGGSTVMPGDYKVVMSFGDKKDSTTIKVGIDPRVSIPNSTLQAKYDMGKEVEGLIQGITTGSKQLRESLSILNDYEKKLKDKKGDEYKEIKELTKATKDSLTAIQDKIFGPVSRGQGIIRSPNPTVLSYVFNASRYIGRGFDAPGRTEQQLFDLAESKVSEVIDEINSFYENEWPSFKEEIEKVDFSPFKDYEPIKK